MKRFLTGIVIFVIMLASLAPNIVQAEDDITGHYFEDDMRVLIHRGILTGYDDGTYRPDASVTRAEFTKLLVETLGLETTSTAGFSVASFSETPTFKDVEPGTWYYPAIMAASEQKLVNGYPDGTFGPGKKISRQEMAAMLMRAVKSKGIISEAAPLNFVDSAEINPIFHEAVQHLLYLKIMSGKANDGKLYFAPLDSTTRGETSALINRLLKNIDPPKETDFKVASISEGEDPVIHNYHDTFADAKAFASDNQVIMQGNNIVWIRSGLAVSNQYTVLYNSGDFSSHSTYVTSGVEMQYIDATDEWVKVKLADTTGYVKPETVNLNPTHMVKDRSYYEAKNGDLIHRIYNPIRDSWASYGYGKAPSFMQEGNKYHSWNGNTFYHANGAKAGDAYQYFNRMPLYTETQYTGEQLDEYIRAVKPDSPLIGTGSAFKKAEKEAGTNALYLLAHAIHESAWGTSRIAQDKNNLFGIGANDGNPYEDAYTYESFEGGILEAAETFIVPGYFQYNWKYEGEHLGNKSSGMNVRYASDAYWGQKITGYMYRIDKYLSNKYGMPSEYGAYKLAYSVTTPVNVRSVATIKDNTPLYKLQRTGNTVQVLDSISANGTWYEIAPKNILGESYPEAYVYSHGGDSGTLLKTLPIAK